MTTSTILFFCASLLLLGPSKRGLVEAQPAANDPNHLIVQLKAGQVQGAEVAVEDGGGKVHLFKGIRYGKAARFEKAKPVEPWTGIYDATQPRAACPQFGAAPANPENEDCLFLNVWQPEPALGATNHSVVVYIHGGGFLNGFVNPTGFDSRHLAHDGQVVFVTIAYRLGALGFLSSGPGYEGNLGLHDQILALQWVRDNIAHFGGDPTKVTIWGESAGSWSVSALVLSPLAKGLFHRGILQSGSIVNHIQSVKEAQQQTGWLASELKCDNSNLTAQVECLRAKPLADLQKANIQLWYPVYGDELIPVRPQTALAEGKFNLVDLLYGDVNNEGSSFVAEAVHQFPITLKEAHDALTAFWYISSTGYGGEVVDFYLGKLKADASALQINESLSQAIGDTVFVCPTTLYAEAMAKANPKNAYYAFRVMQNGWNPTDSSWNAIPHGWDVGLTFSDRLCSPSICANMVKSFTSFAKTGVPGKLGAVDWTEAFADKKNPVTSYMALHSDAYKMVPNAYVDNCDAFFKPKMMQ